MEALLVLPRLCAWCRYVNYSVLQLVLSPSVLSALCWVIDLTAGLKMLTSGKARGRRKGVLPPSKWSQPLLSLLEAGGALGLGA